MLLSEMIMRCDRVRSFPDCRKLQIVEKMVVLVTGMLYKTICRSERDEGELCVQELKCKYLVINAA